MDCMLYVIYYNAPCIEVKTANGSKPESLSIYYIGIKKRKISEKRSEIEPRKILP